MIPNRSRTLSDYVRVKDVSHGPRSLQGLLSATARLLCHYPTPGHTRRHGNTEEHAGAAI